MLTLKKEKDFKSTLQGRNRQQDIPKSLKHRLSIRDKRNKSKGKEQAMMPRSSQNIFNFVLIPH